VDFNQTTCQGAFGLCHARSNDLLLSFTVACQGRLNHVEKLRKMGTNELNFEGIISCNRI